LPLKIHELEFVGSGIKFVDDVNPGSPLTVFVSRVGSTAVLKSAKV
jgi:hypothetical protein